MWFVLVHHREHWTCTRQKTLVRSWAGEGLAKKVAMLLTRGWHSSSTVNSHRSGDPPCKFDNAFNRSWLVFPWYVCGLILWFDPSYSKPLSIPPPPPPPHFLWRCCHVFSTYFIPLKHALVRLCFPYLMFKTRKYIEQDNLGKPEFLMGTDGSVNVEIHISHLDKRKKTKNKKMPLSIFSF